MSDAALETEDEDRFRETGELPEGCYMRSSGVPANPRFRMLLAQEDLNGAALNQLTPPLAEELALEVDLEDA